MRKLLHCTQKGAKIVSYKNKPSFEILDVKIADIETLSEFISANDIISVSFETNIYADTGDFVSLSNLASYTAIKNAVNNLGIFAKEFEVSFKKIKAIDKTKATFYYIAATKDSFEFIDNLNCTIEQCVPVEIAIKNLFCNNYADQLPVLAIIEKDEFIMALAFDKDRLLNTKKIYKEGFGTESQELIQFVEQTQHSIKNIFCLCSKELHEVLKQANIETIKPFFKFFDKPELVDYIEILGLLYKSDINFLTQKHKDIYDIFKHSQIANKIAYLVLLLGFLIFIAGFNNYFKIIIQKNLLNTKLNAFRQDLNSINLNVNATNLQNSINLYAQYEKSPKLNIVLSDLSNYKLPNLYFVEVNVSNDKNPSNIQNATSNQTISSSLFVDIKGVVFGSLDQAKSEYSVFLTEVSKKYKVDLSNFYYLDGKLLFNLKLEVGNASL